jgi:hypothetical protein
VLSRVESEQQQLVAAEHDAWRNDVAVDSHRVIALLRQIAKDPRVARFAAWVVRHRDAAPDRSANSQAHRTQQQLALDELAFERHRAPEAANEEVRPETLPRNRITDLAAHVREPRVDDQRDRRIVEEMLVAANLDGDAALARKLFRRLRIFEEMEPVVLFAAVRLAFARAVARQRDRPEFPPARFRRVRAARRAGS